MFASDIGHWDVPDVRQVLPEAWSLVEDGQISADEFYHFACGNVLAMLTSMNPAFFAGAADIAERGPDRIRRGSPLSTTVSVFSQGTHRLDSAVD